MKKLFFLILFFISIQSFGQRFPSVDSLQNYILRYVRNSTVETFTNLRMQNVVYGLSELLESRAVDSIWRVIGKDSIFFRKNGATYAIKDSTGGIYTAGNGLTLSGSEFKLGGTLNENTTIAYPFGIEFKVKSEGSQGNNNRIEYYAANGGFAIEGYSSGSIDKVLQISGSGINLFYNNGAVNIGGNQIQFKNGTSNGVYSQTTTDTTAFKPLVLNTSTGLVSRMTSWPSFNLQQVTDNGNTTNNGIYISDIYVQSSPSDTSLVLRYDVGGLDKGARFRFNKLSDESNNHYYFPNKSGTLPLSVRLNGTTYTSNDTGSIELGTISTDTTSLSNRINNNYTSISVLPDSAGFIMQKPNGTKDTVTIDFAGNINLIVDTTRIVTTDKTQTITGRKTFNGQTFFNKDSLPITTGKLWHIVVDTPTNQLMRQQVTSSSSYDALTERRKGWVIESDFLFNGSGGNNVTVLGTPLNHYSANGGSSQQNLVQISGIDGELRLITGTSANGYGAISGSNGTQDIYLSSTDTLIMELRLRLSGTPALNASWYGHFGFTNAQSFSTSFTNNFGFTWDEQGQMTGASSTSNWQIMSCSTSTRTFTTTSTSIVRDGSTFLKLTIKALSNRIEYFVNGVSVGTITGNIPTTSTALSPNIYIRRDANAGGHQGVLDIDYLFIQKKIATPR